jgi:hypothetical protein
MAGLEDSKNVKSTEIPGNKEQGSQLDEQGISIMEMSELIKEQSELMVQDGRLLAEQGELIDVQGKQIDNQEERIDELEAGMDMIPELIAKQGADGPVVKKLSGIKPVKHPVTRKWVSPEVAKKAQIVLDKEEAKKKKEEKKEAN